MTPNYDRLTMYFNFAKSIPMISCILLSAGFSSRFGSPKALVEIDEEILIQRILRQLTESRIDEIIVVLGHENEVIKSYILNHKKVKVVYNKDYNFGQTSSFKCGLSHVEESCKGMMLYPVDFPVIKSETINQLAEAFISKDTDIQIPVFNTIKGHPPIFSYSLKKALLDLDNNEGINTLNKNKLYTIDLIEVDDPGILKSFNTLEELEKIKSETF